MGLLGGRTCNRGWLNGEGDLLDKRLDIEQGSTKRGLFEMETLTGRRLNREGDLMEWGAYQIGGLI